MQTICTECNKQLLIKDEAKGKKARCPHCKAVFVADEYVEAVIVVEEPEPPAVDVEIEDSKSDDDPNWSFGEPVRSERVAARPPEDAKTLRAKAVSAMRSAAYMMLVAFILSFIAVLLKFGPSIVLLLRAVQRNELRGDSAELACGVSVGLFLYGLIFVFLGIATRNLFIAGSRGLIITGIVLSFLVMIDLLAWMLPIVFSVLEYIENPNKGFSGIWRPDGRLQDSAVHFCGMMFLAEMGMLAHLFAAIRSIFTLRREDVKRYYHHKKNLKLPR